MNSTGQGHNSASFDEAAKPRSMAAYLREQRVVPGGSMRASAWFKPHPPYAARGEGCWLIDLDDNRILDCLNNFFSLIHGHAFPPVLEAVRKELEKGTAFGVPTESEILLAETIAERNPRLEQTRFANSGTEAVLHAIKGARALTGRHRIAKFEGCYHGAYDWVEVSLDPSPENWDDALGNPASVPYNTGTPASVLAETVILPFGDPERCAEILRREGPTLAAIIVDPHPSRPGTIAISPVLVDLLNQACRRDGIMLIVDEIVSFRLAVAGATKMYGLEPDLVVLGKVIGGGLPIGAVSGPTERMAVYNHTEGKPKVALAGTFSANPLSMSAGIASLQHFDEAAVQRLNALGDDLRYKTSARFAAAGVQAFVSGVGSLFRLHVGKSSVVDYRSSSATKEQAVVLRNIHRGMLERDILLTPFCSGALSVPMTANEIDLLADSLADITIEEMNASPLKVR